MPSQNHLYIGLMSGTSLDGIDGVLIDFANNRIEILEHAEIDYPDSLKQDLFDLFTSADNEIERLQFAGFWRNELALQLVERLSANIDRNRLAAIADHGQTLRHYPNATPAYTLQLHQGAQLAEKSGIDCVVDFRSADVAAGGQGAPLAPAFHQAVFAHARHHRLIVNIGGLANISLIAPSDQNNRLIGYDSGPGNTLLDTWCKRHTGKDFDENGQWGASGTVHAALLAQLLNDPYFQLAPPKSTGREYFNLDWLQQQLLASAFSDLPAVDIQATLTALTAHSIAREQIRACELAGINPDTALEGVYICGGGANNQFLMEQLDSVFSASVSSTETLGIAPKHVEAAAFAWLGKQTLEQRPVDLMRTTGARHNCILGTIYRA